jgi:plasmid stabilization system protein ParE
MYKAVILPLAKQDIKDAARWYNSKQKGLGKRFTKELREKVKFIRLNPKTIAIRYLNTRTAILDVFPFMIHFSILEKQKKIVISAVFHTSRNDDKWIKRNLKP